VSNATGHGPQRGVARCRSVGGLAWCCANQAPVASGKGHLGMAHGAQNSCANMLGGCFCTEQKRGELTAACCTSLAQFLLLLPIKGPSTVPRLRTSAKKRAEETDGKVSKGIFY